MTQTSISSCVIAQEFENNFKNLFFLLSLCLCLLTLIFPGLALAQGTQAGLDISNTATVTYKIAGTTQPPLQGLNNFKVDRKIDLVVTGVNNASVAPGDTQAELTFTLLNEGNDIQVFELSPDPSLNSDNFDTSGCTTTVTSVSGTPLPGVSVPTNADIKLSPDQSASVSVKCNIPLNNGTTPISSGGTSLLSLKATAIQNNDGSATIETTSTEAEQQIDTVFADDAGSDDIARDASHSARRTYTASTSTIPPTLTINKSILEVKDPSGGNSAISGSEVTYKINITSNGMGAINNVVITDVTPADMTYKPGSMKLDSNTLTDISDADQGDFGITSSNTATVQLGNITAGSQYEIQLTYTIN